MGLQQSFLENSIFSNAPVNWIIHSQGFYYAGLKLVEAGEKLEPRKKYLSTGEIFHRRYTYKIAVYLLSHAIELLLKTIISAHNQTNPANPLKSPERYSHNVLSMIDDLIKAGVVMIDPEDYETCQLIDAYLKWFGRYYRPHEKEVSTVINEAYTAPDKDGMVEFKYKLNYPKTHRKLDALYQQLKPPIDEASLTFPYIVHCP